MNKNLKIKAARAILGMTQNDLAKSVRVARQTIIAVESGKYNPSISLCIDMCKVLGKTLDDLFWEEDNRGNSKKKDNISQSLR